MYTAWVGLGFVTSGGTGRPRAESNEHLRTPGGGECAIRHIRHIKQCPSGAQTPVLEVPAPGGASGDIQDQELAEFPMPAGDRQASGTARTFSLLVPCFASRHGNLPCPTRVPTSVLPLPAHRGRLARQQPRKPRTGPRCPCHGGSPRSGMRSETREPLAAPSDRAGAAGSGEPGEAGP